MKIAVFIKSTTFHIGHGGMEVQNKILVEGLIRSGNEVTVFSPCHELSSGENFENGVIYRFLDVKYRNKNILESVLNFNVKSNWYQKSFDEFKKDHFLKKFDLVISQSSAGLGVIRRKVELKLPVISISHGTILNEFTSLLRRSRSLGSILRLVKDLEYTLRTYLTTQKEFILNSDKVVAVSEFVKKNVIKETHVKEEKVVVIHNGVKVFDPDYSKRLSSDVSILYVGRLEEDKGVAELINLFSKIVGEKNLMAKLIITGEGEQREALENLVHKLSLSDKVFFTGLVRGSKLIDLYESSNIFVLPTKRVEGFPVTIPEAMMAGLPIVAFDMGGVCEGVIDGKTGFLIKSGDWQKFHERLSDLVSDETLREEMSQEARAEALNRFTDDKMVDSYLGVIESVVLAIRK